MCISFQTTNLNNISAFREKHNHSVNFGKIPTPETIRREKRIKTTNTLAMLGGTGVGVTLGCLKTANKLKGGIIGGVIGLVAGKLIGFLLNPRVIQD